MILTCPCCGGRASIEAMLTDDAARASVAAALGLPARLKEPVLRYLALFRPEKNALSWARASKLLAELAGMIESGTITRDGRVYAAPLDVWVKAFDVIQAKMVSDKPLSRPLKNHGYLLEIVKGMADRAEAKAEQAREDSRRSRPEGRRKGMADVAGHIDALKDALK